MFATVRVQNPPHPGRYLPGRFFPNGVVTRLEIVADAVAEAQLKPQKLGKEDPGLRRLEVQSGPYTEDGKSDMTRITESGYELLKADPAFSVLEDAETQGGISHELVAAAREQIASVNADLVDVRIELSATKSKLDDLTEYSKELEKDNAELVKTNGDLTAANAKLAARVAELEAAAAKAKPKAEDAKPAPVAPVATTPEPAK